MSTRIERDFTFQAAVHFEEVFTMNIYEIGLAMIVDTDSIVEQNIAMDRIKHFLSECLENSVFVHIDEKKAVDKYSAADIKVCTLPEEPYDQIITLLLLLKLNAITEGRLHITDIVLKSVLSDGVKFSYDIESALSNSFDSKGWWNDSSSSISTKIPKKDKVVKITKNTDWDSFGLEWAQKPHKKAEEIIFTTEK